MWKKLTYLKSPLQKIENALEKAVEEMGEKSPLRDAVDFSLQSGGKRFRPLLVLSISEGLGKGYDVMDVALGAEFFHTASLIADDLPCMDNEMTRRNKPSLHVNFGESVAILASYTLIASGYERIYLNTEKLAKKRGEEYANFICRKSLQSVSSCAGIQGATNGQYLDLFSRENSLENIQKIMYQKTVTLFEISLLLGWMYGGGDLEKIDTVIQCAYNLGMAFQIADDIQDEMDLHDHSNIVKVLGKKKSMDLFEQHKKALQENIQSLSINSPSLDILLNLLYDSAKSVKA